MNEEDQSHGGPAVPVPQVSGGLDPARRQQFVLKLVDALGALTGPAAIEAEIDRRLVEHLAADRAFCASVDADGRVDVAIDHHTADAPSIVGSHPLDAFGRASAEALRSGRTLVFADVAAAEMLSPEEKQAGLEHGIAALIEVPRVEDGRLAAVLAVHQLQPRNWKADEIALVEEVAARAWTLLDRARAEAELQDSEAHFRSLFETMGQGYVLAKPVRDADGRAIAQRVIGANAAFARLAGLPAEDIAEPASATLAPPWDKAVAAACDRVTRSGRPERLEQWIGVPGHWFDVRAYPAGGDRVAILYENIDGRKRAEAVLRGSEDRHAFLLTLSDALRDVAAPDAVAGTALRLLASHLDLDRAWIGNRPTPEGRVEVASEWLREGLEPIAGAWRANDFPEADRRMAEGTLVVGDIATDPTISARDRESLAAIGVGACICAGLRRGGRHAAWALVAATRAPRAWNPAEVELVEEAAERTWNAVQRAQAEDALGRKDAAMRQQAGTFNAVLRSISDFAYVFDLDGRFTYVNEALLDLWGLPLAGALGKNFVDLGYPPELAARLQRQIQQVIDTGESVRDETLYTSPTGVDGYYEYILDPVFDPDGRVETVAGSTRDITSRRRAEEVLRASEDRHAFLLCLSDALRSLADPAQLLATAIQLVAEHLRAQGASWFAVERDQASCTLVARYHEDAMPIGQRLRFADFGPGLAGSYRRGRTMCMRDTELEAEAGPARAAWRARDARAWVAVPIVKHGRLLALLGIRSSDPREWTHTELQLLEDVAERTWLAAERVRAEAALRESEQRYRTLFDSIDEGFCTIEVLFDASGRAFDYRFLAVNAMFEQQTGLRDAVGRTMKELEPRHERHWFDVFGRIARTGKAERFEQPAAALGRWYDVFAFPLGDPGGARVGVLFKDVSERKHLEATMELVNRIGGEVAMLSAPDEIMQAVGARIGAALDVSACAFVDVDAAGAIATVHHGWNAPDAPNIQRTYDLSEFLPGEGFARACRAGEAVVVRDTGHDPRTDAAAYAGVEMGAFVAVPFRRGGKWVAYLAVVDRSPRDWREDEIAAFKEITSRVFPRIERARAEAALRASEEKYRTLFDSIDQGVYFAEAIFTGDVCTDIRCHEENPAARRVTGRSFAGRLLSEMGDYEPYWCEILGRVARTGKAEHHERYAAPDGIWYDFHAFKPAWADADGVAVTFRDVTERKRSEHVSNLLATIVEYSDDAMVRKDLNGIIQTWNGGAERMFGYTAAEVIGKSVTILMPPDRVDEEPGILAQLRRGERVDHYETVRQRKDGSLLDVSLSVSPIRDKSGTVVAASKVVRDITARKRVESALRDSERRQGLLLMLSDAMRDQPDERAIGEVCVRMLAEHMRLDRCWIMRIPRDHGQAWPGPEFHADRLPPMFGDSGGVPLAGLPERMRRVESETIVVRGTPRGAPSPGRDTTTDGAIRMPAFIAAPLRDDAHDSTWVLVAGSTTPREWIPEDVHLVEDAAERAWAFIERARIEAALRESEAKLQRAAHAKDEFLAMLGHELRNPLAPITTTLELMKLRAPDTFVRERGILEGQVRYLTALVDDLLDVSRIANGKIELKLSRVDIGDVVATAVETTQAAMEARRQTLHVHVDDGLVVSGDRRRLVQVLVNLLGNAAKYSPPDRNVYLSAAADDGQVVVRVRDEGQGIAPALLPHVFELFTQDAQPIDRARGGLGLGLAIVRNLMTLHGGSVTAASDGAYKGSEFTVRLPLLEPVPAESAPSAQPPAPRSGRAGDDTRIKVLIVDDYPLAADSLAMLLQEMGYRTRVARDGAEGLRAVGDFQPDIALVDIGLPVIDGYEVAQTVRATPAHGRLPLVAITGYGQASDRARVMAAGFDEHVIKPLDAAKIGELIERLVAAAA